MSLGACIPDLVAQGRLTPKQAKKARDLFDGHAAELGRSMSPAAAEAVATKRTLEALEFEAIERSRRTLLQVKAQDFTEDWLTRGGEHWGGGDRGGAGGIIPGQGPIGPANAKAGHTLIGLVEARRKAIEGEALSHVRMLLRQHKKNLLGQLRNPAELDDIGREAFGEDSGSPAARELAAAVAETQEWLRLRANAAGANIGKLEKRGFATHHDTRKVAEVGFDAWFAAERPRWDLDRMVDEDTGQPFTPAKLEAVAREVHAAIASDGFSKRSPGAPGRTSFANRLGQHRFIHYRDYNAWAASQAQFGSGTAFDALLGEVKGMSRAIAAMEILGPNPEATVRFVQDRVAGEPTLFEPGKLRERGQAASSALVVDRLWKEYTGALRQPENRGLALGFSAYRALASAAKLGSAPLTAIGDIGTGMATRRFNGLPVAGVIGQYLKQLNPLSAADRLLAARLSFVPETWASEVAGQTRFLVEELTGDISRRVSDGVLRASGLNAITDAGRNAWGLSTFVYLTTVRDRAWADLEPAWRSALERYRIGAEDWDRLRAAPISADIDLVEPGNIEDQELRTRFLELAHNEQDFAVVAPDLAARSYLNANVKKGTLLGELLRSSPLMFKTFTVGFLLRHGGRMVEQSGARGKLGYALSVIIPTTVMGVLAQQLYEIANGRDPKPMDPSTPEGRALWGQGMVKGGGASIIGDLAGLTAQNRYMSWAEYAAGPLIGDAGNAASATYGIVAGKPRAPWQLAKVAKGNTPGANVWYARLVLDRLLADQVQRTIDPKYDDSWRQMNRRAAEQGQEFYWAPGELAPSRAPDLYNAVTGGTRQ